VDRFIGPYYLNYETTRNILIRQGRDIFLCSYFGDVDKFRTGFCVPASNLMDEIFKKAKVKVSRMSLNIPEVMSVLMPSFDGCFSECLSSFVFMI
jgi:hypothetical protein